MPSSPLIDPFVYIVAHTSPKTGSNVENEALASWGFRKGTCQVIRDPRAKPTDRTRMGLWSCLPLHQMCGSPWRTRGHRDSRANGEEACLASHPSSWPHSSPKLKKKSRGSIALREKNVRQTPFPRLLVRCPASPITRCPNPETDD